MKRFLGAMKEYLSQIYVVMMFVVLTLYMDDGYYNTLEAKGSMLFVCSLFYVVTMLIVLLTDVLTTKEKQPNWWKQITKLDKALAAFALVAFLSAVCSSNIAVAFCGSDGCRIGAVHLILISVASIFLMHFLKMRDWIYSIIVVSGYAVFLLGITDCLDWDLFGWREYMASSHYDFLSTIGNRDWYVGYIALVVPFVAVLFMYEKDIKKSIFYGIHIFLGFINLYITKGNGNLLIFGSVIILIYLALTNKQQWRRFVIVLWIFVLSSVAVEYLCTLVDPVQITGVCVLATLQQYHWYVLIAVAAIVLGLLKERIIALQLAKKWLMFCGLVIESMFLYVGLTFTREFGTNRGYIWSYAVQTFKESNLLQKLIGWGPDCFKIAAYYIAGDEIMATWPENNQIANAHNEVLQYLVTMGIIGMIIYLIIYLLVLRRIKADANSLILAAGAAVFGYFCTALGNNPQALNYGILFVFIAFAGIQTDLAENRK